MGAAATGSTAVGGVVSTPALSKPPASAKRLVKKIHIKPNCNMAASAIDALDVSGARRRIESFDDSGSGVRGTPSPQSAHSRRAPHEAWHGLSWEELPPPLRKQFKSSKKFYAASISAFHREK